MDNTRHPPARRIGVNLLWLRSGQVGGSQEYLVRQLLGAASHMHNHEITLYVLSDFARYHPELASVYRCIEAPSHGGSRAARIALEYTWLARKSRGLDLVHHGGGTLPHFGARRTVLTMHDVQYLSFPEYFSNVRLAYLRRAVPSSLRRATIVTTPSNYVRQRLIEAFDMPSSQVRVVRHGVDPLLGADATSEVELRRRLGLGSRAVVFLPAITHPHKNHQFLLQLMTHHWTDPNLVLVCAGGKGRAEDVFMREVRRCNLDERVVRIGRVCDADRDGLMGLARALVFPSLYEGFGAPVLEAMVLGTPVIASNCAALPEVVGDAGLVLPLEIDAWADALQIVETKRDQFVAAGKARAAEFSASNSGGDLLAAYDAALQMI